MYKGNNNSKQTVGQDSKATRDAQITARINYYITSFWDHHTTGVAYITVHRRRCCWQTWYEK